MKKFYLISLVFLCIFSTLAAQEKSTYYSSEYGFSINPPKLDTTAESSVQICYFFLPPIDGFSANVNIQKQIYADSLQAYDELSLSQFEQMNFTLISHNVNKNIGIYEYKGDYQGQLLHWYSIAQKKDSTVLLVTATTLDSLWNEQKTILQESINSFKLND
jgi:hypothetical protein